MPHLMPKKTKTKKKHIKNLIVLLWKMAINKLVKMKTYKLYLLTSCSFVLLLLLCVCLCVFFNYLNI